MALLLDLLIFAVLVFSLSRALPGLRPLFGRALRSLASAVLGTRVVEPRPAEVTSIVCRNCGTVSPSRARFCSHCGASLLPSLN